jgi:hypothetical protein
MNVVAFTLPQVEENDDLKSTVGVVAYAGFPLGS